MVNLLTNLLLLLLQVAWALGTGADLTEACDVREVFYEEEGRSECVTSTEELGCTLRFFDQNGSSGILLVKNSTHEERINFARPFCTEQNARVIKKVYYWDLINRNTGWIPLRHAKQFIKVKTLKGQKKIKIEFLRRLPGLVINIKLGCRSGSSRRYEDRDCALFKFSGSTSYPVPYFTDDNDESTIEKLATTNKNEINNEKHARNMNSKANTTDKNIRLSVTSIINVQKSGIITDKNTTSSGKNPDTTYVKQESRTSFLLHPLVVLGSIFLLLSSIVIVSSAYKSIVTKRKQQELQDCWREEEERCYPMDDGYQREHLEPLINDIQKRLHGNDEERVAGKLFDLQKMTYTV